VGRRREAGLEVERDAAGSAGVRLADLVDVEDLADGGVQLVDAASDEPDPDHPVTAAAVRPVSNICGAGPAAQARGLLNG
jgi:hypothetical protein